MTGQNFAQGTAQEEVHEMEVDEDCEFMEVDQTDMSHDDGDDDSTANETSQLRRALGEVRQEILKMTVDMVNTEKENQKLRKELEEKEQLLEDCDASNNLLLKDNLKMTEEIEEMKERLSSKQEVLDMYEGVREGEARHYQMLLIESGELQQRILDDEKKFKELQEKYEQCREDKNRAIIARDKQNRENAALRNGMPSLILADAAGSFHQEDCSELYRTPRITPFKRCKKCFPNLSTD